MRATIYCKKSLQLRFKSIKSVQNNLSFCHLKVVFWSPYKLCTLLRIPLIRKFGMNLFIVIHVAAAMLLIIVKRTDTFLQELQNIWVFQI